LIGVVVIGTGFGCYTHVRTLREAGFEVMAVVGRDEKKTAERAALFEIPRACSSLTEALSIEGVEAVTIATPPLTHADLALEAIAAHKHVLCEKPLASSAAEGRKMCEAAEAQGVVHLLGTEFRYDGGQATLARAVRDGLVGSPKMATWIMNVPVLVDPGAVVPSWWADAESKGGWLWAHGSQLIDQIRVTVGEFEGLSASLLHVVERADMTADDGFVVHFRCTNGVVGLMQSTASDRGILVETRVTGSDGTVWIEGVGETVKLSDRKGTRSLPVPEELAAEPAPALPEGAVTTTYEQMITFGVEYAPYKRLAAAFRDRIQGERTIDPQPATFEDGVRQMAVLDAIGQSVDGKGAWVTVESDGRR
jgi:predicted dehydrogenase